ncbi:YiiX/YebB-like N1pC/P60 family cysteine hydrolase [Mesorhizobium sp. BAC0120]|uniref:YiiX/YebB-like N1pC/P60 family cysteine hydrolase n=1 Tax=Mesorhizobium sp. BAC0120 TaxID=3090670 RepID=UPI00298D357D|nr:YiiX/YebB-like N1pC/P60 family cysteine hydrolase [Mesorhizobium sp. BAC0120]MDW6025769.1 YiiX/YebB-like N1pC/P60 family cysteine hydrolase [Mesorhizobium sp. BAC0120]
MTEARDTLLDRIGKYLARSLEEESSGYEPYTPSDPDTLRRALQPGDILLIEGNQRISATIKYLTQSTWSHAALYIGDALPDPGNGKERPRLIEVNLGDGCIAVPVSKYRTYNTRICRAHGLSPEDRETVVSFMVSKLGLKYDTKNILDMLRYFFPVPVPVRWRRRMIAFGSGDPTRAICSSLIAEAFEQIRYPILPEITRAPGRASAQSHYSRSEILHIRHHSLYTPRDFDLSPYFAVIKPTLEYGFDYRILTWEEPEGQTSADNAPEASAQKTGT